MKSLGNQNYIHIPLLKTISFMNRKHKSYLAQCQYGILLLNIEMGRWWNIPLEDRICEMCNSLVVEDEYHLIFQCSLKISEILW